MQFPQIQKIAAGPTGKGSALLVVQSEADSLNRHLECTVGAALDKQVFRGSPLVNRSGRGSATGRSNSRGSAGSRHMLGPIGILDDELLAGRS